MTIQKTYWGHIEWLYTHHEARPGQSMNNIGLCVIEPGQRQYRHVHYGEEQFLYILRGESLQIVDGEESVLNQGMHMLIKAGASHETVNTGAGPIVELLVSTPVSYHQSPASFGRSEGPASPGNIYVAVEAIRTQLRESFQVPFTIFDAGGAIVLQNHLFPGFCLEKCEPATKPEDCDCLAAPESALQGDARHQWFVCRHGLLVYHLPVFFRSTKLGAVRGGHIVLSEVSGDYGLEEVYDTPQSTAIGIQNMLAQIITSLVAYCEFDAARGELARKNQALVEEARNSRRLERTLRQIEDTVTTLRINRHFLFNTLNCMAGMALQSRGDSLYSAIINLSKLFRYVTPGEERRWVALAEELEYLDHYLTLQQFRYGDSLVVEKTIDPDTAALKVPFNFLQPVLENAFVHGFRDLTGRKTLSLQARKRGERLVIVIGNSGARPDAAAANRIRNGLANGSGHGLSLIHNKLAAVYGQGFDISVDIGEMTRVSISLPLSGSEERV